MAIIYSLIIYPGSPPCCYFDYGLIDDFDPNHRLGRPWRDIQLFLSFFVIRQPIGSKFAIIILTTNETVVIVTVGELRCERLISWLY